jgi:NTE family protein
LKIALALSGGGHRAAAFHLGVMKYLAEHELLESITDISSTSGGSIVVAQLFHSADEGLAWPSSEAFLTHSLAYCKKQIVEDSLERSFITRMFTPKNWSLVGHRANLMARALKKLWGISKPMAALPAQPSWIINGTTNISGSHWYIEQKNKRCRMGSLDLGEIDSAHFPIADAVAISAAYPGIIGPYRLINDAWDVYLSDGGLYDNLGLEPLFDIEQRALKQDIEADFLLVSDAGMGIKHKRLAPFWRPLLRTLRLIDVINHQVRSLRLRTLLPFLALNPQAGRYLAIGTQSSDVVLSEPLAQKLEHYEFLTDEAVEEAKNTATSLANLSELAFDNLLRHGYETALLNLSSLAPKQTVKAY